MKTNDLPHNLQAEQAILGALLKDVNHGLCKQSLDLLNENSFYSMSHRVLFLLIKTRAEHQQKVDMLTVISDLEKQDKLDQCGGFVYIAELIKNLPSIYNVLSYVELVNQSAQVRDMVKMAHQVIEQSGYCEPEAMVSFVESNLKQLSAGQTGKLSHHISDFGNEWLDKFEQRQNNGGAINGLETGIADLDERLAGFDDESLIVLAGRPSMGKTLMAQTIMDNVGGHQQKQCLFFSMEMSETQVYERFVSKASNLCANKLRTANNFTDEDWGKLNQGVIFVNNSKISVDADAKLTVGQIRARVRRQIAKRGKLALIVIDYLGLMRVQKADRHDIAIGEITSSLKELAKEVKTPILLLAQANRDLDKSKRPSMSNLKDSSAIEADADVVLFVHREEVVDPDTELKGVTELIIAKDRHNNGNGTIYLVKANGGFYSMDQQSVADLYHKEDIRKQPVKKSRGYSRGAA